MVKIPVLGEMGRVGSCVSVQRPPVEDTESFLEALLSSYGRQFFTKVFGPKGDHGLDDMGGVHKVAVALSGLPSSSLALFWSLW